MYLITYTFKQELETGATDPVTFNAIKVPFLFKGQFKSKSKRAKYVREKFLRQEKNRLKRAPISELDFKIDVL